ncbi:MAG: HD domain-containing protein [Dehalococcoidales bacterium]|nr:MAG: HD domain-containing protein [Dehalococcoidales bacterium]
MPEKNPQDAQEIEEAVVFLVTRMMESGHNPKPVVLHSVRMGMYLYNYSYEPDIVKAAILHDITEDSDTSIDEIKERFGERVAQLVQANTFDSTAGDRAVQGEECLQRCLEYGMDAFIVKAADKLENSFYVVDPVAARDWSEFWVAEMRHMLDVAQPVIGSEPIWQELNQQCHKLEAAIKQLEA